MNANATTPAIITINPNRELRKDQWKEMALQQQSHIGLLMKRLEQEKDICSSVIQDKLKIQEELAEFKDYYDKQLAQIAELEAHKEATCDYEYLKESHLTEKQLKALQDEAYKAGRACGYEDAESEFEPYKRQEELDALRADLEQKKSTGELLFSSHTELMKENEALRAELAEIKDNDFPCDVYWAAINGEITLYKIPNEIACLNTPNGDNAVLEAFQSNCFGEEWGTYSKLEVVEMTLEMLEEELGEELVEREEEPETPKSTKDLVIDQLNEEPHSPVVYLESAPIPELVEGGERRFTITEIPAFEPLHKDATHQVVRGYFGVEFVWKVPAGINLRDTDTYEFGDKWGVLYISNKITGEDIEIEEKDEEDDWKRAHTLEVEDRDDDDNAC